MCQHVWLLRSQGIIKKSCLWLTSLLLVEDDSNPFCACSCPAGCYWYFRCGYPQSTIQNSEHLGQYEFWILSCGFMGPLPLKPRSGNDKAPRTLVVQAFACSCMASMSTSICIRYSLVWYTINPFISLWFYRVIKVAKVGPLSYI